MEFSGNEVITVTENLNKDWKSVHKTKFTLRPPYDKIFDNIKINDQFSICLSDPTRFKHKLKVLHFVPIDFLQKTLSVKRVPLARWKSAKMANRLLFVSPNSVVEILHQHCLLLLQRKSTERSSCCGNTECNEYWYLKFGIFGSCLLVEGAPHSFDCPRETCSST